MVAVENTQETQKNKVGGGRDEDRGRKLTVPCGPVTISRVCSVLTEGWEPTQGLADWAALEKDWGSNRK